VIFVTIDTYFEQAHPVLNTARGTANNLAEAVLNLVETTKSIGSAIKKSFIRDVVNGNEYSRSYWIGMSTLNWTKIIRSVA